MAYTQFFDDLVHLNRIDWPLMTSRFWNDTASDGDRKRRRQAEFLVYQFCPWQVIRNIGVIDATVAGEVEALIHGAPHRPLVNVERNWYY